MLKLNELKQGNLVMVNDEGVLREGRVTDISHADNQVLLDNGIQEFWFNPEDLSAIALDEKQLFNLGFTGEAFENGMKYKKEAVRLVTPQKNDFTHLEMWYREDRRSFHAPLKVHELQNLYYDMTKVYLEKA